ncbi:MAG: hypoxanthine phosphoribosyltransferase [Thermoguttaceae bacterium]
METLFTETEIREAVGSVADALNADYRDQQVLVIGVATGAIVFLSDLVRRLQMPVHLELVHVKSYRGAATRPGRLDIHLLGLAEEAVRGRRVLVVDDIFDTGRTLEALRARLLECGASDVKTAVFLEKAARRETEMRPDYVGLQVPDRFVVGYGLDYDGRMRNLPYIAAIDGEKA